MAYVVTKKKWLIEVNGKEYYDHELIGIGETVQDALRIIQREVEPTEAKEIEKLLIDGLFESLGVKGNYKNKYREQYDYEGNFEVEKFNEDGNSLPTERMEEIK